MRRLSFIAALLPLLFLACATSEPARTKAPTLPESRLNEVRGLIDSGSYLQALQEVSLMRSEQPAQIPAADVDALESKALESLAKAYTQALADKKYQDAIRLFDSAVVYGRPELVGESTEKSLVMQQADALDSSGNRLLSLLARLRALSLGEPTQLELANALSYAQGVGDAAVIRAITERMVKSGFPLPAGVASPKAEGSMDFQQMLKGTVTIWVNRGIRMDKGVGYPDRVIGSGFFIDPRGYLLTNYHVIKSEVDPKYEGYSRLYIRLSETSGDKIPAKVVGYDTVFDLALIKVEMTPEYVFSGLSTDDVLPGQRIFAIGSPVGLEKTITSGIVSAKGRRLLQMGDTMQVDVPLNPGNSGGPLLDERGEVIGIVFAGLEQFQGINFAIPFKWIERVLPRLYAGGEVPHPWLGMALTETDNVLEVMYVMPGEPADKAGIVVGDVLESIDGVKYTTVKDAQEALLDHEPQSLMRVGFKRDGVTQERILSATTRPESPVETALQKDTLDNVIYPLFGMQLVKVGSFLWKNQYVIHRVAKGSVADEAGFSQDDPVTIQDWQLDSEKGYVMLQLYVKKKKQGFMESIIQIAAYLETNNFF
jgi:serine protease Do